jgi:hypothetical protein
MSGDKKNWSPAYPAPRIADIGRWPFYKPSEPCKWCGRLARWIFVTGPALLGWLVIFRAIARVALS